MNSVSEYFKQSVSGLSTDFNRYVLRIITSYKFRPKWKILGDICLKLNNLSLFMFYLSNSGAEGRCPPLTLWAELHTWMKTFEFFLNNTNLTFLAFLYKIDIMGFQSQQEIKLPPVGTKFTTPTILFRRQMPFPLCHPDMCWIEYP